MRRSWKHVFVVSLLVVTACKKDRAPAAAGEEDIEISRVESGALVPRATLDEVVDNFSKVHFATDSAVLDAASEAVLRSNAGIMARHPSITVEIQGHADERGTTDYNLALGQKRADAVRRFLVSQGVPGARVKTVSYGEERPAAQGRGEVAWAQNRRAEFRILPGVTVSE